MNRLPRSRSPSSASRMPVLQVEGYRHTREEDHEPDLLAMSHLWRDLNEASLERRNLFRK